MKIEIPKTFYRKLQGRVEQYDFEVGILEDKTHYEPLKDEFRSYAGGPVRKKSRTRSELTTGEIFVQNMRRLGKNLLLAPFRDSKNQEIVKFAREFLKFVISSKSNKRRVENLLQAVVRNPILRGDYGGNTPNTSFQKGFDRHLFDTGQMFQLIKAKANRKNVRVK